MERYKLLQNVIITREKTEKFSLDVPMTLSRQHNLCSNCTILAISCILAFSGRYIILYSKTPDGNVSFVSIISDFISVSDLGMPVFLNTSICEISFLKQSII